MAETKSVNYKRATATKTLKDLMSRVAELNASANDYKYVKELYIFGSYLRNAPTVHDLDVALKIDYTPFYKAEFEKYKAIKGNVSSTDFDLFLARSGPRCLSFIQMLFWLEEKYLRRIKNKSRVISIHPTEEIFKLDLKPNEYVQLVHNGVINTEVLNSLLAI